MLLAGLILLGGSLAILALGWFAYPAITRARARHLGAPPAAHRSDVDVSILIATREPPPVLRARLDNLLANGYPPQRLDIVVAIDPASGFSEADYVGESMNPVRVVVGDQPGGKACALNAGMRVVKNDIVVFADSVPEFRTGAIADLVGFLASSSAHGAVTGTLQVVDSDVANDSVLQRLWQAELSLRRAQAALHSACVVTGCIYALRRQLWQPLPAGTICDDLFVPMRVIRQGYRVGVCDTAIASDRRVFSRTQEFQRKVRTLTGMLQFVRACPWALVPGRNPVFVQFACHKLLRIATPFLLVAAALGALVCAASLGVMSWIASALAACALTIVLLAVIFPSVARRRATQLAWSLLLLSAPLLAVRNALLGRWDVWHSHTSAARQV